MWKYTGRSPIHWGGLKVFPGDILNTYDRPGRRFEYVSETGEIIPEPVVLRPQPEPMEIISEPPAPKKRTKGSIQEVELTDYTEEN